MTSLAIVKRHVGEEEKDVGERNIGSVDAEVVRAATDQRQRRRERNPFVVAAGGQTDGVAGFRIERCAAESPAGQPAVAHERFKVVVGIGEGHSVHDSAVSAAVDKVARNPAAPRITVFVVAFLCLVCISRMNRVGGKEQSGGTFGNNIYKGEELLPLILDKETLFRVTDAAINFFEKNANPSERFRKTLQRVGEEDIRRQLKDE